MKTAKLMKSLEGFFSLKKRKRYKRKAELEELLEKLAKRKQGLSNKIAAEKDGDQRKRLAKKLKVLEAQDIKGREALDRLESD